MSRQAFEAFITALPFDFGIGRFDDSGAWPGSYRSYDVDLAWQAYKAATNAALERKPMGNPEAVAIVQKAGFKTWGSMMFRIIRLTEAFHGIKELAPAGSELPTNSADQAEVTSTGQIPAWHDAPTVPGLWVCRQAITDNVQAYEVTDQMALNRNLKLKGQWYGPIPEDRQ